MTDPHAGPAARPDGRHWKLAVAAGMASFLDSGAIISVGLGLALWKKKFELDVSTLGVLGISVIFGVLAVLAVTTFAFRAFYPPFKDLEAEAVARHTADGVDPATALPLRALLTTPAFRAMIVLTALFYGFFTLVANTFGAFKTYFLVTVGGTSQTTATALSFLTTLIGLAGTIAFTRIADTKWRSRLFVPGVALFTSCQLLIAVTGGTVLPAMIAALVLYNLAFPFIGEALYKIWTQESFPVNARATVQGATMAAARFVASAFALLTPALIAWSPTGLYLMLTAFALVSGSVGAVIIRRARGSRDEPALTRIAARGYAPT
jgi:inositol transporter-like SP family MFS transporter